MTKGSSPIGGSRGGTSRKRTRGSEPLDQLRAALDAVAGEPAPAPEQAARLEDWLGQIARTGALRRAPLSPGAIDLLAQALPDASVTSEYRSHLERARLAERARMLEAQTLAAQCPASSPPELLRLLRERAGLTAERAAALFSEAAATWVAVEQKRIPWYRLRGDALPAFATAVGEQADRLLALLTLTAQRALYAGVEARARHALGRFDGGQAAKDARQDTLRMAFARVQDENQGAAAFLKAARQAAGNQARPDGPSAAPQPRKEGR